MRAVSGAPACASGGQLAIFSPCGRYVLAGTRGTLTVLRTADLAVLDVVKLSSQAKVTGLAVDGRAGSRLAVVASDKHLRVFSLHLPPPPAEPAPAPAPPAAQSKGKGKAGKAAQAADATAASGGGGGGEGPRSWSLEEVEAEAVQRVSCGVSRGEGKSALEWR